MKINILILFIIIFYSFQSFSINVNQTIESTIQNNPKVKIGLEKLNESRELIENALGAKLPTITSTISGTYSNSKTSTTTPETFTDKYKLNITQNLYDAGYNDLEIERSKILFDTEIINFKIILQDLILEAIMGYLTVINYEKSLEATLKNYEFVLKALEETKTKFNLGSSTLYELQRAESSFAVASVNLYEADLLPLLRMCHKREITPCSWVKLKKGKYSYNSIKTDKKSFCQYEFSVDWTNLYPLDCEEIAPVLVASYDIECTSGDGSFPQPSRPADKLIQIGTTVRMFNNPDYEVNHIITLKSCKEFDDNPNTFVEAYETEAEVIMAWQKFIRKIDPDIITGYNILGFDYNYLYERARMFGLIEEEEERFGYLGRLNIDSFEEVVKANYSKFLLFS